MKTEYAWLIEANEMQKPIYWNGAQGWTREHMAACRFCRKADAERVLVHVVNSSPVTRRTDACVVEHGWDVHEDGDHLIHEHPAKA